MMGALYRVFAPDGNPIGEGDSIDEAIEMARNALPGRYRIDCLSDDTDLGVPRSRTWGRRYQIATRSDHFGGPALDRLTDAEARISG